MARFPHNTASCIAEISQAALLKNVAYLQSRLPSPCRILPMVKTNAYGHGVDIVLEILSQEHLAGAGVATFKEALHIRNTQNLDCVMVFGRLTPEIITEAQKQNITLTAHSLEDVKMLSKAAHVPDFHIELETGMHRLGLSAQDLQSMVTTYPDLLHHIKGVFTHFAQSEEENTDFTGQQVQKFESMYTDLGQHLHHGLIKHLGNSGFILYQPQQGQSWLRPGIALYGFDPRGIANGNLFPVMTWKAPIVQIHQVQKGESIGYNRTFVARRKMLVATVGVGYGDGYARAYQPVGVGFQGIRVPTVGRICMDNIMIDVTDCKGASQGDEVLLMGPGNDGEPTAEELAKVDQTISYEVVSRVSSRVTRIKT